MGSPARSYKHPQRILLRYKRNYMREWRARPENFNRERRNRQRAYAHQKLLRNDKHDTATVRILPLASIGGKNHKAPAGCPRLRGDARALLRAMLTSYFLVLSLS